MSEYHQVTSEEWYQSLDDETRKIADQKIGILKKYNAGDPLGWVCSEMRENIPQVARFMLLHRVRSEVLNGSREFAIPDDDDFEKALSPIERTQVGEEAFNRLIKSGANREDLVRIARAAACEATLDFIGVLDGLSLFEEELEALGDQDFKKFEELHRAPDWALVETVIENDTWKMTGRVLNGLHESIDHLYPEDD